jgi:hypothetical protein
MEREMGRERKTDDLIRGRYDELIPEGLKHPIEDSKVDIDLFTDDKKATRQVHEERLKVDRYIDTLIAEKGGIDYYKLDKALEYRADLERGILWREYYKYKDDKFSTLLRGPRAIEDSSEVQKAAELCNLQRLFVNYVRCAAFLLGDDKKSGLKSREMIASFLEATSKEPDAGKAKLLIRQYNRELFKEVGSLIGNNAPDIKHMAKAIHVLKDIVPANDRQNHVETMVKLSFNDKSYYAVSSERIVPATVRESLTFLNSNLKEKVSNFAGLEERIDTILKEAEQAGNVLPTQLSKYHTRGVKNCYSHAMEVFEGQEVSSVGNTRKDKAPVSSFLRSGALIGTGAKNDKDNKDKVKNNLRQISKAAGDTDVIVFCLNTDSILQGAEQAVVDIEIDAIRELNRDEETMRHHFVNSSVVRIGSSKTGVENVLQRVITTLLSHRQCDEDIVYLCAQIRQSEDAINSSILMNKLVDKYNTKVEEINKGGGQHDVRLRKMTLVVHCASGKDRTGVVCLGNDVEAIAQKVNPDLTDQQRQILFEKLLESNSQQFLAGRQGGTISAQGIKVPTLIELINWVLWRTGGLNLEPGKAGYDISQNNLAPKYAEQAKLPSLIMPDMSKLDNYGYNQIVKLKATLAILGGQPAGNRQAQENNISCIINSWKKQEFLPKKVDDHSSSKGATIEYEYKLGKQTIGITRKDNGQILVNQSPNTIGMVVLDIPYIETIGVREQIKHYKLFFEDGKFLDSIPKPNEIGNKVVLAGQNINGVDTSGVQADDKLLKNDFRNRSYAERMRDKPDKAADVQVR